MIEIRDCRAVVICDVCRKPIEGKDNGNVIWSSANDAGTDYRIVHSGRGSADTCDPRENRGTYKCWMTLESFFKHDLLPTLK